MLKIGKRQNVGREGEAKRVRVVCVEIYIVCVVAWSGHKVESQIIQGGGGGQREAQADREQGQG